MSEITLNLNYFIGTTYNFNMPTESVYLTIRALLAPLIYGAILRYAITQI